MALSEIDFDHAEVMYQQINSETIEDDYNIYRSINLAARDFCEKTELLTVTAQDIVITKESDVTFVATTPVDEFISPIRVSSVRIKNGENVDNYLIPRPLREGFITSNSFRGFPCYFFPIDRGEFQIFPLPNGDYTLHEIRMTAKPSPFDVTLQDRVFLPKVLSQQYSEVIMLKALEIIHSNPQSDIFDLSTAQYKRLEYNRKVSILKTKRDIAYNTGDLTMNAYSGDLGIYRN